MAAARGIRWHEAMGIALLLGLALPPLAGAGTTEDVAFGCGLVNKNFLTLGVEVLDPLIDRIESVNEQAQALQALADACTRLGSQRHPEMTADEERRVREDWLKKAGASRDRLAKIKVSGSPTSLDALLRQVESARQLQAQIAIEQSPEIKKQLSDRMAQEFKAAIGGLDALYKKVAAAMEAHLKKEPDGMGPTHDKWERELVPLQEQHLPAGVEFNRARYTYSKTLPASEEKQRQELLKQITEDLEALCAEYDTWAYTIVAELTLSNAYADRKKYSESAQAAEAGAVLTDDMIKHDPKSAAELGPWKNRLLDAWAFATGKLGKFDDAIARVKEVNDPEVRITYAEILLMKVEDLLKKKDQKNADRVREDAKKLLDRTAETNAANTALQLRVTDVRRRYGLVGTGYFELWQKLERAVQARNNAEIMSTAMELLGYGDALPPDKRAVTLKVLAMALRQEKRYFEAYTVYVGIATSPAAGDEEEAYANLAVVCLQSQFQDTKDAADEVLLDRARRWQRDLFGGPGKEYGDAADAKKAGDYQKAIQLFATVPKESMFFESAVEQTGECYVLWAKQIQKTNPAESEKCLAQGKDALQRFLTLAAQPSPIPKIVERRKQLRANAIYRLASVDLWDGKEDYKACLEKTRDFPKRFPEATALFPYVSILRVRALVVTGDVAGAESELNDLHASTRDITDATKRQQLVASSSDLVFRAFVGREQELRKEADRADADAAKPENSAKAEALKTLATDKRNQANDYGTKAAELVKTEIAVDPNQPYEKYSYLIWVLDRLQQNNDLRTYLDMFLKRFADARGLTLKQRTEIDNARVMLGIVAYKCGDYETAYRILAERTAAMDAAFELIRRTNPNAKRDDAYWSILLYKAKAAKQMSDKSLKYAEEAVDIFLKLRDMLNNNSADWWDVTVSLSEVWNARGRYDLTLPVLKRFLMTRPELGGRAIRQRYAQVLEEIYRRDRDQDQQKDALSLLADVQMGELQELRKEKRYTDALRLIRDFKVISIDYGGRANRAKFLGVVEAIQKEAPDPDVKKEAEDLAKELNK